MTQRSSKKLSRRQLLARTTFATVAGLGVYAFGVEPRWVSVEHRQLPIKGLPAALENATAVQISDLHIGSRVGDDYLRKQFAYVAALQPDFVFFTGDYLDDATDWHLEKGRALMSDFPRGRIGTACVLGNHDYGYRHVKSKSDADNAQQLIEVLRAADLNPLLDESVELGGLHVAGLRDLWYGGFNLQTASQAIESVADKPSVVLSHNPDTADLPIWNRFKSWVLSGHTHGGQCRFPVLGAPILPVRNKRYVAGQYDTEAGHRLYINRGLGHTHRIRFMTRPEITVFRLQQQG